VKLKRFAEADDYLAQVLSVPTQVLHPLIESSLCKAQLTSLIVYRTPYVAPKFTAICVSKQLENEETSNSILVRINKSFEQDNFEGLLQLLRSTEVLEKFQRDNFFWLLAGRGCIMT
jgi:CRISPR/Cas system-associated protein Csm6